MDKQISSARALPTRLLDDLLREDDQMDDKIRQLALSASSPSISLSENDESSDDDFMWRRCLKNVAL